MKSWLEAGGEVCLGGGGLFKKNTTQEKIFILHISSNVRMRIEKGKETI